MITPMRWPEHPVPSLLSSAPNAYMFVHIGIKAQTQLPIAPHLPSQLKVLLQLEHSSHCSLRQLSHLFSTLLFDFGCCLESRGEHVVET